jgi:polyphosphate kinase
LIRYLRDDVLAEYMKDNVKARLMHPDGIYQKFKHDGDKEPVNIQVRLFEIRQTHKNRN